MNYTDLLFVFAFLPVTLIISLFDRSAEYKNLILIISSVIFFTWGRPSVILLLFVTVIFDYAFGILASKEKKSVKIFGLSASFLMNGTFFVIFARNFLFRSGRCPDFLEGLSFSDKLIPLGIAFYTLRGASYVFDVFRKNTAVEKNPFCLLTYMVSYHFMFAGPLVRYGDIRDEIRSRRVGFEEINGGITRFIMGLGKAVVLAPVFKSLMEASGDFRNMTQASAVYYALGFLGYYFWAFWGYCDMAVGLGKTNGFSYKGNISDLKVTEGLSKSVYFYNGSVTRLFSDVLVYRGEKKSLTALSTVLCAVLVGMWYGFYKGAFAGALVLGILIAAEKLFLEKRLEALPKLLVGAYTTAALLAAAVMFGFDSYWKGKSWLKALAGMGENHSNGQIIGIIKENYVLLAVGVIFAIPIVRRGLGILWKKICERNGSMYGVARIAQTVFTAAVLFMYTVITYNNIG